MFNSREREYDAEDQTQHLNLRDKPASMICLADLARHILGGFTGGYDNHKVVFLGDEYHTDHGDPDRKCKTCLHFQDSDGEMTVLPLQIFTINGYPDSYIALAVWDDGDTIFVGDYSGLSEQLALNYMAVPKATLIDVDVEVCAECKLTFSTRVEEDEYRRIEEATSGEQGGRKFTLAHPSGFYQEVINGVGTTSNLVLSDLRVTRIGSRSVELDVAPIDPVDGVALLLRVAEDPTEILHRLGLGKKYDVTDLIRGT
jgi:hypothetical protein